MTMTFRYIVKFSPRKKESITDFIKIKNFALLSDTVKRMRREATDWEKIFTKDTSDKALISKTDKEFLNSVLRGQTIN